MVKRAIEKVKGEPFDIVAETVKQTAFKITRMGQLVGQVASEKLGVPLELSIYHLRQLQRLVIRSRTF